MLCDVKAGKCPYKAMLMTDWDWHQFAICQLPGRGLALDVAGREPGGISDDRKTVDGCKYLVALWKSRDERDTSTKQNKL